MLICEFINGVMQGYARTRKVEARLSRRRSVVDPSMTCPLKSAETHGTSRCTGGIPMQESKTLDKVQSFSAFLY